MALTDAGRARMAANMSAVNRRHRMWERATNTGAKTPEGRAKVGRNATKDGARGREMAAMVGWLESLRRLLG